MDFVKLRDMSFKKMTLKKFKNFKKLKIKKKVSGFLANLMHFRFMNFQPTRTGERSATRFASESVR